MFDFEHTPITTKIVLRAVWDCEKPGGPITAEEYNALEMSADSYNEKQLTKEQYDTNAKGLL